MARVKSIEEQLKALMKNKNLGQSAFIPDAKLEYLLLAETRRLKGLLAKHIRAYYALPGPTVYERSNISLDQTLVVKYSRQEKAAYIYFGATKDEEPWGEPVVRPTEFSYGFKPILIDSGWQVNSSAKHAKKYRFGHYEGYHFIEKAIKEFQKTNTHGLQVYVNAPQKITWDYFDYEVSHYELSNKAKDAYDKMGIW